MLKSPYHSFYFLPSLTEVNTTLQKLCSHLSYYFQYWNHEKIHILWDLKLMQFLYRKNTILRI